MKIAVIIPYYKEDRFVIAQTIKSSVKANLDKIYLINDGGNPLKEDDVLLDNDKICHVAFNNNLGRGSHRQRCNEYVFSNSEEDYITFLDADDLFSYDFLLEVKPILINEKPVFLRMRYGKKIKRKTIELDAYTKMLRSKTVEDGDLKVEKSKIFFNESEPRVGQGVLHGLFIKRDQILNKSFIDANLCEDIAWTREIFDGRIDEFKIVDNNKGFYIRFMNTDQNFREKYKDNESALAILNKRSKKHR